MDLLNTVYHNLDDPMMEVLVRNGAGDLSLPRDFGVRPEGDTDFDDASFDEQAAQWSGILAMLTPAPSNRAWSRRSWLVMLRARLRSSSKEGMGMCAAQEVENDVRSGEKSGCTLNEVLGGGRAYGQGPGCEPGYGPTKRVQEGDKVVEANEVQARVLEGREEAEVDIVTVRAAGSWTAGLPEEGVL